MTLLGRLRRVLGISRPRRRFDALGDAIDARLNSSNTGPIDRATALTVPALQRGRNMICSIATLPLVQYGPDGSVIESTFLEQIDPDVANVVTLAQTVEDLLCDAIAWWEIIAYDWTGYPVQARRVDPGLVSLTPPTGHTPSPLPSGLDPRTTVIDPLNETGACVYIDGREVEAQNVIRFDSPNPGVLAANARAIRRAILLEKLAAIFAENPRPLDYFTPAPGAEEIDDDEITEILATWKGARRKRSIAWIPKSLIYNSAPGPNPAELQLVELQQRAALDIANGIGVDPEDLGVSTTSRTYSNNVDRRRDRINDVLSPYLLAITQRLSMGDVTRRRYKVAFDLDDYLKSNPTERWATYKTARELGVITKPEIRLKEGWGPMPPELLDETAPAAPATHPVDAPADVPADGADGGDQGAGTNDGVAATSDGLSAMDRARQAMAGTGPRQTFDGRTLDDPNRAGITFEFEGSSFTFDAEKRTVEGLILPFGKWAGKYGLKFRFDKDSLQYADIGRVKLTKDHYDAVGVAMSVTQKRDGYYGKYKIARGAAGDELISLAEDGVYDGFSVGVDFDLEADVVPDPKDASALLVKRADLRETALTAMPAFDDARLTNVQAARNTNTQGVSTMDPCATCGQRHAANVACVQLTAPTPAPAVPAPAAPVTGTPAVPIAPEPAPAPAAGVAIGSLTLTSDQLSAILARPDWSTALAAIMGPAPAAPGVPVQPVEPRQFVNPTTRPLPAGSVALVREAMPYRFDRKGNLLRGTHDFSADLFAGLRSDSRDQAAYDRALSWVQAQFNVITTDVDDLNPARQRPDLWVDQRDFKYPIWDAINKGALTDITPFIFPKFNSATGLVAPHVEGTEPASGTYVTTSQTVTPTANSGKAKVSREVWDQGGNPQISTLIWNQMLRGWFEALEAAAVAVLDAATPTSLGTFTVGGGANKATLVAEMRSFLALLNFVRGGFTMRDMYTQVDLYSALVAATDTAGRPIFSAFGQAATDGSSAPAWASLDINGVQAIPTWALAPTGIVAASSYLFDRQSVHGWASAPQKLTIDTTEVANVYIGLFGYKAAVISDINGVREVIYDPA